jgi:hypothetical protein
MKCLERLKYLRFNAKCSKIQQKLLMLSLKSKKNKKNPLSLHTKALRNPQLSKYDQT